MDSMQADPIEEVQWRTDEYVHTTHDELIVRMNDTTSQFESSTHISLSLCPSEDSDCVLTSTSFRSVETANECRLKRVLRLKSEAYTKARMNDGCTFLMMECCTSTLLARTLCGDNEIKCMSTFSIEDIDAIKIQDGWRVNVLSTPHKAMSSADLNYIKRELENSFGVDADMDACPRGCYTIALSDADCNEYASFVAFRAFAAINHRHNSRLMLVYIDHLVTKENHRRKHLGKYMIDLIKRTCVPVCQMYRIPSMHVVTQASFQALPFWSTLMSSCADACLIMLKLIQMSALQDDSGPNRRTGRFKIKLFADVIDMLMEVPVP